MRLNDDNSQKFPFGVSMNTMVRGKAQDAIQALGKGLPCTVAAIVGPGIVTVNFEVSTSPAPLPQMTMPVGKPPYIQYPIQVGDIGVALSADLRTGGITGLGAGTPSLGDTVGNLSAMTFFWLGSTKEEFVDPEAVVIYENIVCTPTQLGFFGHSKETKQSVTGALSAVTDVNAKAVLTSLIHALSQYGLITNSTT